MRHFSLFAPLFLAAALSAQPTLSPPGGNVGGGSVVRVTNPDPSAGQMSIVFNGNVIWSGTVSGGGGTYDITIPTDSSLIGQDFTIKVCTNENCVEGSYHCVVPPV